MNPYLSPESIFLLVGIAFLLLLATMFGYWAYKERSWLVGLLVMLTLLAVALPTTIWVEVVGIHQWGCLANCG